jgi:para-aminobenzoate synthetase component I
MSAPRPARATALRRLAWREPLDVLAPWAEQPYAFALLSDGSEDGRWSYVGAAPAATFGALAELRDRLEERREAAAGPGPPFRGGAVGVAAYELGATLEASAPQARRTPPWPDLIGGVYDRLVAFDHHRREAWAVARGAGEHAEALADDLAATVATVAPSPEPPSLAGPVRADGEGYPAAVAQVVAAIARGEIFQANIARGWRGRLPPGATPFDLLRALHARSPAPFAGYFRMPDLALVSRSPERFVAVSAEGVARTSPIKGTRPRGRDADADARLAAELLASEKDRAENRMIVDVMRNDLARACLPGTVQVEAFCALRSFSNVHHLVSTVAGRLAPGRDALDLFASAFPPASVTGAPKLQAMRVIARHEPPRGPYCGAMFRAGFDGAFDSSVLIRTVALDRDPDGWRWEARAGAGITADSDPAAEDAEAVQKARAVLAAFDA